MHPRHFFTIVQYVSGGAQVKGFWIYVTLYLVTNTFFFKNCFMCMGILLVRVPGAPHVCLLHTRGHEGDIGVPGNWVKVSCEPPYECRNWISSSGRAVTSPKSWTISLVPTLHIILNFVSINWFACLFLYLFTASLWWTYGGQGTTWQSSFSLYAHGSPCEWNPDH